MMPSRFALPIKPRNGSRRTARALSCAAALSTMLAISACSSKPPTPAWQIQASSALSASQSAYLDGNERVAAFELNKARADISRTGSPKELARLELHQCAMQLASLDYQACTAFSPLASSASAQERNYALYLQGQHLDAGQRATLPETQQSIAAYNTVDAQSLQTAARIEEPLSRLVAIAALSRRAQSTPAPLLELAINTASQAGWRRPLLAWLLAQKTFAQAQHLPELEQATDLRIAIVQQQGRAIERQPEQQAPATR